MKNDSEQIHVTENTLKTENLNSYTEEKNFYDKSHDMNRTFIEKPILVRKESVGTRPICVKKKPKSYIHSAISAHNIFDNISRTYNEAINSEHKNKWIEAMYSEINSLLDNGTWTLKNNPDACKPVSCGCVFKIKYNNQTDPVKYKAKLVAKGYSQVYETDYHETYAPVAKMVIVWTLFSTINSRNLFMYQINIKIAFLNSHLKEII